MPDQNPLVPGREPLFEALRRFAHVMSHHYDVTDALYEISDQITDVVGATGAGVALFDERGELRFVTATSEATVAAEQAQERTQSGPCLTAIEQRRPVPIRDLREHADEWPAYTETVTALGLFGVLGLPMIIDGQRVGSLDVYDVAREWTEHEVSAGALMAEMASAYVLNASEIDRSRRTAEQLQAALDSRVVIEQAKGKLAGERGLTMDEAFKMIRQHARSNNATVRSVAQAVVERGADVLDPPS